MGLGRTFTTTAAALVAGVLTPLATPDSWLAYLFGVAGVVVLVFGCLAAGSAEEGESASQKPVAIRIALWAALGTDQPGARLADTRALRLFFAALTFLAGLTVGAFAAVRL